MKMPFEWVVGDSSKGLHGDRAHVYDERTGHRELHHDKGHYWRVARSTEPGRQAPATVSKSASLRRSGGTVWRRAGCEGARILIIELVSAPQRSQIPDNSSPSR